MNNLTKLFNGFGGRGESSAPPPNRHPTNSLQYLAKQGFSDSQSQQQLQSQSSQSQQQSQSSTPLLNHDTNISHINVGVQQAIDYQTKIQENRNLIARYNNKIEENTKEIATLRTQVQQMAKEPPNSYMKKTYQDGSKRRIRRIEVLKEHNENYRMLINGRNKVIQEYTKKKRGKMRRGM